MGLKLPKSSSLFNEAERRGIESRLEAAGVHWTAAGDAVLRCAVVERYEWAMAAGIELGFRVEDIRAQFLLFIHSRHNADVSRSELIRWERRHRRGGAAALVDGHKVKLSATPQRCIARGGNLADPRHVAGLMRQVPGLTLAAASEAIRRAAVCERWQRAIWGGAWLGFNSAQVTARFLLVIRDRFGFVASPKSPYNWNRARLRGGLPAPIDHQL